jgi:hypothetical protein
MLTHDADLLSETHPRRLVNFLIVHAEEGGEEAEW